MIEGFLASWDLFHTTYLAGWAMGMALSQVGVVVVARDQIFIGAALSQASGLGIAAALWIGQIMGPYSPYWAQSDGFLSFMAVIFSVTAALITTISKNTDRKSHEAVTGWVFLLSTSLSVLLLSHSPHGLDEIQRLMSSSIIGATGGEMVLFFVIASLSWAILIFIRRPLVLLIMDPEMAGVLGVRTSFWSGLVCAWLGLTLGLSIRCAGMLYAFGCLVLPALISQKVCREVRQMFLVAPLTCLGVGVPGFILANHLDFPPGQLVVALLCGALMMAWIKERFTDHFKPGARLSNPADLPPQ